MTIPRADDSIPRAIVVLCGVIAVVAACGRPAEARTWRDGLEGELGGMRYRYYLPAGYDPSVEYPLVLFLHGSGESGADNVNQVRFHIRGLIDRTESDYPAILVAPQLSLSVGWSPFQPIDRTSEILAELIDEYSVDTDRLYLTGLSMGGFGTMEYAQRYNAGGLDEFLPGDTCASPR